MMLSVLIVALLSIIPCTGELVTPNPDNDLVCWDLVVGATGYAIFQRDTSEDDWMPVGEVEADFNWWTETPMTDGEYCVKSIDAEGLLSANCSSIVQWDPCAQWNVDIEMFGTPCIPDTCFSLGTGIDPDCTVVVCPPPIPADWPNTPCEEVP